MVYVRNYTTVKFTLNCTERKGGRGYQPCPVLPGVERFPGGNHSHTKVVRMLVIKNGVKVCDMFGEEETCHRTAHNIQKFAYVLNKRFVKMKLRHIPSSRLLLILYCK